MSIPTFVAGYPPDGSSLGATKTTIRNNIDGTFETVGVDHYTQNSSFPGMHQHSTYPLQTVAPTTVNGQIALYAGSGTSGTELFMIRDGVPQTATALTVTGVAAPNRSQNGFSWLPGNILLQWGFISIGVGVTSINFNTAFASVPGFAPIVTITGLTASSPTNNVYITGTSNTQFSINNFSSSISAIYWHAIGPI